MMIGENIKNVLLFTAGLVVGSVVTWKMAKDKYEQWANDEIRMMREYYNQKEEEYYEEEDLDEEPIEAEYIKGNNQIIEEKMLSNPCCEYPFIEWNNKQEKEEY